MNAPRRGWVALLAATSLALLACSSTRRPGGDTSSSSGGSGSSGASGAGAGGRGGVEEGGGSGDGGAQQCTEVKLTPYPDCGDDLEGMPCSDPGETSACCSALCGYCQEGGGGAQAYVINYGCVRYRDGLKWRSCGSSNGFFPDCGDLSSAADGCSRPRGDSDRECSTVYWFNPASGCERSCASDGIVNRFSSQEECEAMCGGPPDAAPDASSADNDAG
jgi:hypothetical protein